MLLSWHSHLTEVVLQKHQQLWKWHWEDWSLKELYHAYCTTYHTKELIKYCDKAELLIAAHCCIQILVAISAFLKDIYGVQTHNNEYKRDIENEIDTKIQPLKTCDVSKCKWSPFAFQVSMISLLFFINWFLWYFRIALFTMPFHWNLDRNTDTVLFWLRYLLRSYVSRTEQILGMKPNCLLASKFLHINRFTKKLVFFL